MSIEAALGNNTKTSEQKINGKKVEATLSYNTKTQLLSCSSLFPVISENFASDLSWISKRQKYVAEIKVQIIAYLSKPEVTNVFVDQVFRGDAYTGTNPGADILRDKLFIQAIKEIRDEPIHYEMAKKIKYLEAFPQANGLGYKKGFLN